MLFRRWPLVASVAFTAFASCSTASAETKLNADGSLEMAGRRLRCESVRTRLDRGLPNLGAAALGERLLLLNPRLLARELPSVQLFVFHHECGHHYAGRSELEADCWAVARGLEQGWLDRRALTEVCRSFGDAPETITHPSGQRRCANLDRCFVEKEKARIRKLPATLASARPNPALSPRLIAAPRVAWVGTIR